MINAQVANWLLAGDVAIQYQVHRDLLNSADLEISALQKRIADERWGAAFLSRQNTNGHWGRDFYQPKWTSSHYTLLDLKMLGLSPTHPAVRKITLKVLENPEGNEGGINYSHSRKISDVCVNGMILNFASWFVPEAPRLQAIVDYLLHIQMADGGWNCAYYEGHTHSSLHSTLSVLEGLWEFSKTGRTYREKEIGKARQRGLEFLLVHRLFRSHRTGAIIDPKMLRLSFPSRWRYDILRTLDHFRDAAIPYDGRMQDALEVLKKKEGKAHRWPLQAKHPGQVHFDMEKVGEPSRWNTLRALRVLAYFNQ
ncbi:MAG: hypothetical protein IPJ40_21570 [Saprospirales bacterium]|nr:hypothetical protein [Saprospirales bacterium]